MYKCSIKKIGLLVFGIWSLSSAAVEDDAQSAAQILQQKLTQLTSFKADFIQTVVDGEDTVLQQAKGKIALLQPNKLYWELLPPNDNILIADGNTLWNIDAFMEQVVAYDQLTAIKNNPLILLTDPSSTKWQDYNVENSDDVFVISSKTASGNVEALSLTFNKNNQLLGLKTTDVQQQTSRLVFTNIKQNQPLKAETFVFTLPEGYELDDQRENER